jgi:hypothetical protein
MPGITLAQAEAKLAEWMDAESKVAVGQSYTIHGRQLTRADLDSIGERIKFWNGLVAELSNLTEGRGRSRVIVPAD